MRLYQIIFSIALVIFSTNSIAKNDKIPIIIDTDMASEDWMAMLYLFKHNQADVKAITVTGTGEAHCNPGVSNALKLLNTAKYKVIPVTCGREEVGLYGSTFPDSWRTAQDNFLPVPLYGEIGQASKQDATTLLINTIKQSPDKITIVVLGPLTNIADALQADTSIKNNIEMIYVMGGAVNHPGNIHTVTDIANKVSEWNLFVDPLSASVVLNSGVPVTLVPLDATQHVPITSDFIRLLGELKASNTSQLFHAILESFESDITSQQWHFWDTLTATLAVNNQHARFENYPLVIKVAPLKEAGQTIIQKDGVMTRVAIWADNEKFTADLLKTIMQ